MLRPMPLLDICAHPWVGTDAPLSEINQSMLNALLDHNEVGIQKALLAGANPVVKIKRDMEHATPLSLCLRLESSFATRYIDMMLKNMPPGFPEYISWMGTLLSFAGLYTPEDLMCWVVKRASSYYPPEKFGPLWRIVASRNRWDAVVYMKEEFSEWVVRERVIYSPAFVLSRAALSENPLAHDTMHLMLPILGALNKDDSVQLASVLIDEMSMQMASTKDFSLSRFEDRLDSVAVALPGFFAAVENKVGASHIFASLLDRVCGRVKSEALYMDLSQHTLQNEEKAGDQRRL